MKLSGYRWAWWNQYGQVPVDQCVRRAREADMGVILKWGFWDAFNAFKRAGVPLGIERYAYWTQPEYEAELLDDGIDAGAEFAVINAETAWEMVGPEPMERLLHRFRQLQPEAEIYGSVDTRGNRPNLPYQQVLAREIAGWLPMIYPKAFYPGQEFRYIHQAFIDALYGVDFGGVPVMPTIQGYDGIGSNAVREQVEEVQRRGLAGCQLYTIGHATDAEWEAYLAAIPEEDRMPDEETRKKLGRGGDSVRARGVLRESRPRATTGPQGSVALPAGVGIQFHQSVSRPNKWSVGSADGAALPSGGVGLSMATNRFVSCNCHIN